MPREFLSSNATLGSRERIYAVADALEVDEFTVGEIERRRVFFDDVLALTYRRFRGLGFLLSTGLMALSMLILAVSVEDEGGVVIFGILCAIFAPLFLLRLIFGVDEILVFGRRSSARLVFRYRKGRARAVHELLLRKIREAQAAAAAARAAEAPPPVVDPSLAPPPDAPQA